VSRVHAYHFSAGDRRNFEFRPGNDIAKFEEDPVACATLDIYEDLDYEGDMEFSVLLVDVFPYDIFLRGNIQTDFLIHDSGGKDAKKNIM
jgi:hypothetical protein